MKKYLISFKRIALTVLVSLVSVTAAAGLPNTDLKIQLREVAERDLSGYVVGTQATAARLVVQSVSVKNGEKASLRLSVSMPMQWLQKVDAQSSSATVSGITSQGSGVGITNALMWLEAGQSVTVTPRWPGGKQPVSMEIDFQTAMVDERTGAELPNQTRSQLSTTINAAMGAWVTIAKSGQRATAGSYSSSAATDAPQLIQIRVTVN
jgi:hypothetical protein